MLNLHSQTKKLTSNLPTQNFALYFYKYKNLSNLRIKTRENLPNITRLLFRLFRSRLFASVLATHFHSRNLR